MRNGGIDYAKKEVPNGKISKCKGKAMGKSKLVWELVAHPLSLMYLFK